MSIEFTCGHCGVDLRVQDEKAGLEAACPNCAQPIQIPASREAAFPTGGDEQWTRENLESEVQTAPAGMPPAEATDHRRQLGDFRPQTVIVWMVILGMLAMLITDLLYTAATAYQLTLLKRLQQGGNIDQATLELSDVYVHVPAVLYLLSFIGTSICWMVWKYGANKNASRLSDTKLEYSPGWTVGCYFVPFANLVWPYQAMKEIWNASTTAGTGLALVGWWWGLWILNGVIGQVTFRMSFAAETVEDFIRLSQIELMLVPLEFAVILVAGTLVWRIHRMQQAKAGLLDNDSENTVFVQYR